MLTKKVKSQLSSSAYTLSCPRPKACRNPPFFFGAAPFEEAACFAADLPCLTLAATPFEADLRAPSTLGVACCASACSKADVFCVALSNILPQGTLQHTCNAPATTLFAPKACAWTCCSCLEQSQAGIVFYLVQQSRLACMSQQVVQQIMMHCSLHWTKADACNKCPISTREACTANLGLFGAAKQASKWILRRAVLLVFLFLFFLLLLPPK